MHQTGCSFIPSFVIAGRGPAYSGPMWETVQTSNVLAQERGGELFGVCKCVHDVQERKVK